MREMVFTLFTPERSFPPVECDSVRLSIAESADGKFSGSYGIRKGHAKAIFSLGSGKICVSLNGRSVFSCESREGFATVENDEIRVIAESVFTEDT